MRRARIATSSQVYATAPRREITTPSLTVAARVAPSLAGVAQAVRAGAL